jgi:hypothetical protein
MENPTERCRNCQHPLPERARFCPACGQKNTDGRLTFQEMASEFVGTLFNLDNRIFSTLGALAVPGRLTQRFFEGKHVRYYHPLRLFIVSAGIFTALMTFKASKSGLQDAKIGLDERKEDYQKKQQVELLENLSQKVADSFNDKKVDAALDSLGTSFRLLNTSPDFNFNYTFTNGEIIVDTLEKVDEIPIEQSDSLVINNFMRFGDEDIKVAINDLLNLDEEQLLTKYKIEGWKNRLLFRQYVRINKGGSRFFLYMVGNTIWMVLIMMPMLALFLKLLYIRKGFFYYEHLVFSFHTHSFMFIVFSLLIIIDNSFEIPEYITSIFLLFSSLYLFLAMKRFYKQGIFKTILKYSLANILYLVILTLASIFTLMASAVFY